MEHDDLLSYAIERFIILAKDFDYNNSIKIFEIYAFNYVNRYLISVLKNLNKNDESLSYEVYIRQHQNGEEFTSYNVFEEAYKQSCIYQLLNMLPKRSREILINIYYEKRNYDEIGELFGIKRQRVYEIKEKSIKKLALIMQKTDL